jgi:hypothetical protein
MPPSPLNASAAFPGYRLRLRLRPLDGSRERGANAYFCFWGGDLPVAFSEQALAEGFLRRKNTCVTPSRAFLKVRFGNFSGWASMWDRSDVVGLLSSSRYGSYW